MRVDGGRGVAGRVRGYETRDGTTGAHGQGRPVGCPPRRGCVLPVGSLAERDAGGRRRRAGSVTDHVGGGSSRATSRTGAACPFVGPAGELLQQVLDERLDREGVDLTNAVEHFEWRRERNGGFTTRRAGRRSGRAKSGCEPSSRPCGRRCSSVSAGRRLRHSSDWTPAWVRSAAGCSACPISRCRSGRLELAHDLGLACAAAGKDVSMRREVGSRRSHTQARSKGA